VRENLALHLLALFVVAGCSTAAWWQLGRALGGNGLSWAYVFEWPFFAMYAVWMWWKLSHEDKAQGPGARAPSRPRSPEDDEADRVAAERLAAYNQYLAALAAADRERQRQRGERRGHARH